MDTCEALKQALTILLLRDSGMVVFVSIVSNHTGPVRILVSTISIRDGVNTHFFSQQCSTCTSHGASTGEALGGHRELPIRQLSNGEEEVSD